MTDIKNEGVPPNDRLGEYRAIIEERKDLIRPRPSRKKLLSELLYSAGVDSW